MTIHPMGSAPMCAVDNAGARTPFVAATEADSGQTYLVVLQPYQIGATLAPKIRALPMGVAPMCVITDNSALAGLVSLFYSDTGYISPSYGANADIWFEGRVTQPLRMTWMLPVVPEADRRVALEVTGLELINADGAMDTLVDRFDIAGRACTVLFGLKSYAFPDFTPIWSGRALRWSRDLSKLTIDARDSGYLLDVPLQTAFYDGSGGLNGTSALTNKPRPMCFGKCRNVTPQAVDPVNLVYQVHTRTIAGVDAVYDKGVALASTADYASYAALTAAVLAGGTYATCLAQGLVRLGSAPAGGVTMDVRGDAQGGYVSTTAAIARRLLTDFAGVSAAALDTAAFAIFDTAVPGVIGWCQGSDQTIQVSDALSQLMGHCSAWWGALTDGRFTIGRVEAPSESGLTEEFQAYDIVDVEIIDPPDGAMPPRFRQRVGYQRNWTVQQPSELAGGVTAANVLALGQAYLVSVQANNNTQSDFLLAQDPPVLESLFDQAADAAAEATRLIGLLGVMRQAVRVRVTAVGHRIPRGSCVAVNAPRINGGNRWLARYIGADIDAGSREIDLILWG